MDMSITLIVVVVVAFFLLKFAKQIVSKLLGVVLIVGLVLGYMYKNSLGPFQENVADVEVLMEKYCGEDGDEDICDCILKPAEADLNSRFTAAERDTLKSQKIKAAYVLQKSLKATKEQSLVCLASKGATEKYKVFIQDFIPIENKYLNLAEEKVKDLGEKLKNEVESFKDDKKGIDDKY